MSISTIALWMICLKTILYVSAFFISRNNKDYQNGEKMNKIMMASVQNGFHKYKTRQEFDFMSRESSFSLIWYSKEEITTIKK